MIQIITWLINILQAFNKFIWKIINFLSRSIDPDQFKKLNNSIHSPEYNKFKVDEPPIVVNYDNDISHDSLNWKSLVEQNNISPIVRRGKSSVTSDISCPYCSAPSSFIYSRKTMNKGFSCKCCNNYFTDKFEKLKSIAFKCPHCNHFLEKHKVKSSFILYKCKNNACSFYTHNLHSLSKEQLEEYRLDPGKFKLRYIYRAFQISLNDIKQDYAHFVSSPVNLSKIHNSSHVVALCLTYHINYGLSSRKTASVLWDVHRIAISHQTVENYCKSVSPLVHPILENYPYSFSYIFAADETYLSILGKEYYLFFFFDAVNKIITSYRVFEKRDSISAIQATYSTLKKLNKEDLLLITDGNPIYNVSYMYWNNSEKYNIDLKQVVGLKNQDDVSKEYRSQKQIIERLNRTLKEAYNVKGCFKSLDSANNYMVLFSTYFNFLRPHEALNYKTPVEIPELQNCSTMMEKWLKLIDLSQKQYTNIP